MAYILDKDKAIIRQISNDAFFYLKEDEEPIDEDNLEEAYEILEMFPNGFVIDEDWEYIDDDTIQITIIPYVEEQQSWDGYINEGSGWIIQFKIINSNLAHIRYYNENTGKIFGEQDSTIKYYSKKPWLYFPDVPQTLSHSEIPLWTKSVIVQNKEILSLINLKSA